MKEALYYRPSGSIGFRGPLLMVLAGLAGAIVLGAIYAYWMYYPQLILPWLGVWVAFIVLKLLSPLAYGIGCGCIVGQAARLGKVRNEVFVGLLGAALGVVSVYTSWVFWLLAWSGHDYFSPLSGYLMYSAIIEAADGGVDYHVEFITIEGGLLYTIWVIEALVIVVSSSLAALMTVEASENTFCEACEEWAEDVYYSPDLEAIGNEESFRAELEADPLGRLVAIPPAEPQVPGTTSRIRIQACPNCENFLSLDVQKIVRSLDKKGEEESKQSVLVDNLLIDQPLHGALARHFPKAVESSD